MKKKLAIILLLVGLTTALTACDWNTIPRNNQKIVDGNRFTVNGGRVDDIQILTDRETGCRYIIYYKNVEGLAPLYGKDGQVVGCGEPLVDEDRLK
ncbi:DUF6440 family protein [Paenibacillus sp. XY044]|uniref:DUF6440 family protein n=1 Tax=Paenibacillus sp. XY044 TaxID=2026089 RepID=UPI000B981FF6|nr:DUF6440 family protein [Paenibacillus sp. XY044]OZB98133.1 hypothetical protein CJP46_02895 [Paenibacillus sp. XY044]